VIRKQAWKKIGLIFSVDGLLPWAQTHAAVPFVTDIEDGKLTVMFTTRDHLNRSHVGRACFSRNFDLISVDREPILSPGPLGRFDEDGTTASYEVKVGTLRYLYYAGWNRAVTTPFRNALGLAISHDGGVSYQRLSEGPILDRSLVDPCFVAGACVLRQGATFLMWYISCVDWKLVDGKPRHSYHLKVASSKDGINWHRSGKIALDFKSDFEYALSQPWVVFENGTYRMWFSYRGQEGIDTYRIGYAESIDGETWQRDDSAIELAVSNSGWDSQMICYPFVFKLDGRYLMLYNGNEYGKTGFGLAELVE
jgi:hypothetical protein